MAGSDVVMNYSNAKYMTQMTLKFEIVNSLIETDYIKFMLPFPLHRALMIDANAPDGYQRPYGLLAKWSAYDPTTLVEGTQKIVQLFCQTGESSTYFAQFLKDVNQVSALSAGWYKVEFNILDSLAVNTQKEVQLLQIQTSTVSSIDSDAIQYDSNQAHSFLYLDKKPVDSLGLTISFDDATTRKKVSTQQTVFFDLTIDSTVIDSKDNKRFVIQLTSKSAFQLTGTCETAAKTTLPIINNLLSTDYTCTVDNSNNQMILILKQSALIKQNTYRVVVKVQNPDYVMQGVGVTVKALREFSPIIIQTGYVDSAFETESLTIDYLELNLAWGNQDKPSLPMNLYAVRSSASSNLGYTPYNQINLKFKLKDKTPLSQEQRIIIMLNTEVSSKLLTGSIIHNLPSFANKDVVCKELDASDPTNRRIVCSQVGQLDNTKEYFISFKMSFEYEVYEAWIDCEKFGTIQIQSMFPVTTNDNIIAISRDINFINQMRDQNKASVVNIDNNAVFLEKLKSFSDIVILVNAQDFDDYLYEVYATSRPYTFSGKFTLFQDYFVPADNVQFINYLQANYPNIFIAQFPQTLAYQEYSIAKQGNQYLTIQKTVPRNINKILTKNGINWKQPGGDLLASSYKTGTGSTQGFNFNPNGDFDFELAISMNAKFSDVTTYSYSGSGSTVLTNNVGVLLMMNPKIQFQNPTVNNAAVTKVFSDSSSYTCLQIEFSTEGNLITYFPNVAASSSLVIQKMNLQTFSSSHNGIETNLDIFIQTIDGIAGAQNTQTRVAYNLINGYFLSSNPLSTITAGVVNYYSSSTAGIDGNMVPALLRINGQLANTQEKIVVFFDNLIPLYFNESQDLVSCASTLDSLSQAECKVYVSPSPQVISYLQMSRFEVTVKSPSPTLLFQVIIPIAIPANKAVLNLFLGTINTNSAIIHVKKISQLNYSIQGSDLAPFQAAGTNTYQYGIDCISCKVGSLQNSLIINAKHSGTAPTPNGANDVGAGFTYVADYPFYDVSASTITSIPSEFGTGKQSCTFFSYRYEGTSRYGMFCPLQSTLPATGPTVSKVNMPQQSIINAYGAYSTNIGALFNLQLNVNNAITETDISTPSELPSLDAKQKGYALSFTIVTPTDLPQIFVVQITNAADMQFSSRELYQVCKSIIDNTQSACEVQDSANKQNLQFKISVKGGQTLKGSKIKIILYGITTLDTSADITSATIKISDSTATKTFSKILNQTIKFNNEVARNLPTTPGVYATSFDVQDFTQTNLNKSGRTALTFNLLLHSKYLYEGERIQIQFDQFSTVNTVNLNDLRCLVYYTNPDPSAAPLTGPKPLTNDIKTLKFQQISNVLTINMVFKTIGYMKERIYSVECYNFNVPTVKSTAIDFKFFALQTLPAGTENQLFPVGPAVLQKSTPDYVDAMKASGSTSKVTKQYGSPGSATELIFEIKTVDSVIDELSRVLIYFPNYYPRLLSRDGDNIYCLQNDLVVISCRVKEVRTLEIKYFTQQVLKGGILKFTVSGVIQPLNYSVGKFLVVIDNNYDDNQMTESITLKDDAVRQDQSFLKGSMLVLKASISSTYLLQDGVNYSFQIYLDSKMDSINYGQYIIVNFPQIFAKQLRSYTRPDCSITKENAPQKEYSGSCSTYGLRIKIKVNELMTAGSAYDISIRNIYNPPIYGPQAYKWIIEIGDTNQEFMLYRSFASSSNYVDQAYTVSPDQQLLNFIDVNGNRISSLSLIKGVISDPVYIQRELQTEFVFARSFTLESITDEISTIPLKPSIIVGTQSKYIQFKSDTAIGSYEVQLQKNGDGNFYANLPTLSMVFDNKNTQVIAFKEQPLKIDLATSNIFLTLSSLLPVDYIEVKFSVPSSNVFTGFAIDPTKATLKFTSTQRSGVIPFTLSSTPAVGTKVQLDMVISGTNAASYTLPTNPVEIEFIAEDTTTLAVSITPTPSVTDPTKAVITASCAKSAMFYWGISLKYDSDITKCALTADKLIATVSDNKNDVQLCYYQFGQSYIQATKSVDIPVRDLRVNSNYRIYGLCVDGKSTKSFTTNPVAMLTADNQGKSMKIKIDFQNVAPTKEQKQKIICFLTLFFSVQPKNVKSFDGTYCQEMFEQKRRMLSTVATDQLNCVEETLDIPIISIPNLKTETFYFAKNLDVNKDELSAKLLSATKKKCFKTYFQTNVIGIPTIMNIYTASQVSLVAPTLVNPPKVYTGPTWGYFDIQLAQSGLVYLVLVESSNSAPTAPQIIKGDNSLNSAALASTGIAVDYQTFKSGNYTFQPLTPGKSYKVYFVLSNECPFPEQGVYSSVYSVSLDSEAIPIDTNAKIVNFSIVSLLTIVFAIII